MTEEVSKPKELLNQIQQEWKKRETKKSQFENGLFYCLSFLAAKAAKKAANYRIIVMSDTPSTKNAEYAQALMGLVETVRTFPTFIDIIRIGENDMYPDDVKLRIISTITSGGVLYATTPKEFKSILLGLAKNKTLPDLRTEGGQEIEADQKAYYENLAKELIEVDEIDQGECMICSKSVCDYCQDPTDLRKCPNCSGVLHSCCAALFSWKYNIGLKNIFRCVSCGALIKMDENLVYEINGEELPSAGIMTPEELEEQMADEETWSPTAEEKVEEKEVEEVPVKEGISAPKTQSPDDAKFEMSHGLFGPTYKKKTSNKATKASTEDTLPTTEEAGQTGEQAGNVPAKKSTQARSRLAERRKRTTRNGTVRICKVCANKLKQNERICPKCGSPAF